MGPPDHLKEGDDLDELSDVLPEPTNVAEMKAIGEKEKALIPLLSHVLEALVEKNDRSGTDQMITVFHALNAPGVSVRDYIERIRRYSGCSPCCFIVGLIYMDRFMQLTPGFVLSTLNVHRLILTSVLLASKFLDDFYYNNAYWGKVGGIPIEEINSLELALLSRLNFGLHITTEDYTRYRRTLLASWARPPKQVAQHSHQNGNSDPKRKLAYESDSMVDDVIKQQHQNSSVAQMDTR